MRASNTHTTLSGETRVGASYSESTLPTPNPRFLLRIHALFPRLRGHLGNLEHLAQIRDVRWIVVHCLRRLVADLGHGLAVATGHLDDDLQRLVADIIGQIRADAEGGLAAALEIFEEPNRERHIERVRKHHRLGSW